MKILNGFTNINRQNFSKKHLYFGHGYTAFTLAEVLITLVIIGIIASITVPTLIQTSEKQEFVSRLKKSHSNLANALYMININSGYPLGDYTYLDEDNFLEEFSKVTAVVKKCDTTNDCFKQGNQNYKNIYKRLNGSTTTWEPGKAIILSDGQMYSFCKNPTYFYGISMQDENNVLGRIIVDVNGQRKPNKYGIDTFFFYVVNGKGIVPAGSNNTSDCKKTAAGITCAAKVLKEGKINY